MSTCLIFVFSRLCASKQLYEQVSCDDPELDKYYVEQGERNMREQEDRDKRVWEAGVSPGEKIQGTRIGRTEYRAHEADIKVRREGTMRTACVSGIVVGETSEQEAEEGSGEDEDDRDK